MRTHTLIVLTFVGASALTHAAPEKGRKDAPAHPCITEVLFHVPTGDEGDANNDGRRDSAGDEFIELFNPTKQTINLKGYRLSSRLSTFDAEGRYGVRFIFPELELPPGGVVVVFNGYESNIKGEVGTAEAAPSSTNSQFGDAFVFSMEVGSQNLALKNGGDFVLLTAPDGARIDCVSWGKSDPKPPTDVAHLEDVGNIRAGGSIQRIGPDKPWRANRDFDGKPFSPGVIPNK